MCFSVTHYIEYTLLNPYCIHEQVRIHAIVRYQCALWLWGQRPHCLYLYYGGKCEGTVVIEKLSVLIHLPIHCSPSTFVTSLGGVTLHIIYWNMWLFHDTILSPLWFCCLIHSVLERTALVTRELQRWVVLWSIAIKYRHCSEWLVHTYIRTYMRNRWYS